MSIKLILFVKRDYYRLSKTIMSPIVHDEDSIGDWKNPDVQHSKYDRFDWGKFTLCIDAGMTISIRKATQIETNEYDKKLAELRHNMMEDSNCDMGGEFPVYEVANEEGCGILVKNLLNGGKEDDE